MERALGLGATKVGEFDEYGTQWTTLADPEGNVFDVGVPHEPNGMRLAQRYGLEVNPSGKAPEPTRDRP